MGSMQTHPNNQPSLEGVDRSVNANSPKPEWIRIPDAVRVSGICRSAIYELIGSGAIKSFSHRKRGNVLGQRLISYDSLLAYLSQAYEASMKSTHQGDQCEGRDRE